MEGYQPYSAWPRERWCHVLADTFGLFSHQTTE
ncbi:hypothetical protein Pan14r_29150 [Crateriforma conspicua]|uniref:Uncharacterized protein n=1 Tax=Crateriforma conspicua TaxID=2527996 RepID=A0A5C5Y6S4_9PLAN|nr:hypothetical protein Mal65_43820 [Crateriforma conspicua]TWT70608.1 hypothetical protein Pan14r_29150 [Crateriforma conspicua]